jgi:hypothetical protein
VPPDETIGRVGGRDDPVLAAAVDWLAARDSCP